MRVGSSLLVDVGGGGSSPIDGLRSALAGGRVIEGTIVGLKSPGRYEASVGGQRLTLMPSKPLEVGGTFTVRLSEGGLLFDFPQSASAAGANGASTGVAVRTLADVLTGLGLPTDAGTTLTLKALLLAGAGLTEKAMQLFTQHATPASEAETLLLAFAIQRGIPVDREMTVLLEKIFHHRQDAGKMMHRLLSETRALFHRMDAGGHEGGVLRDLLRWMEDCFADADDGLSLESWFRTLRQGVQRSGHFREGRWAAALEAGVKEEALEGRDLKTLLGRFQAELDQLGRDKPEFRETVESIRTVAGEMEERIEQAQLASHRAEWESRQVWLIDVPVRVEGQAKFLRLTIEGHRPGKGRTLDYPVRVDFYLDLSYLGALRVALTMTDRGAQGQIFSDRPEVVRLLSREIPLWLEPSSNDTKPMLVQQLSVRQVNDRTQLLPPDILDARMLGLDAWPRKINLEA